MLNFKHQLILQQLQAFSLLKHNHNQQRRQTHNLVVAQAQQVQQVLVILDL